MWRFLHGHFPDGEILCRLLAHADWALSRRTKAMGFPVRVSGAVTRKVIRRPCQGCLGQRFGMPERYVMVCFPPQSKNRTAVPLFARMPDRLSDILRHANGAARDAAYPSARRVAPRVIVRLAGLLLPLQIGPSAITRPGGTQRIHGWIFRRSEHLSAVEG